MPRAPQPPPLFDLVASPASPEDFERYYPRPRSARDYPDLRARRGRLVTWLGRPGRMFKAVPAYTSPREDNHFDAAQLGAVAAAVRDGRRFTSLAPPAHVLRIDEGTVRDTQDAARRGRLWEYGLARAFSTGDEALDRYLADPEREQERDLGYRPGARAVDAWEREQREALARAVRAKTGDLGRYWVKLRDGNHRAFGALLGGEPHVWVQVDPEHCEAPAHLLR